MTIITIPYAPRWYQQPIHEDPARFQVVVAHRRAGKTVALVNHGIRGCLTATHPRAQFAYVAPTYKMAKRIAWDYLKQYSAPVPGFRSNMSELTGYYPNGSRLMLLGADRIHDLRGIYLMGVVLDEYALMHPRLFTEVILPALMDHGGWAILAGTPLGANQLKRAYVAAKDGLADWSAHMLRASTTKAISERDLKVASDNMTPEEYAQEFECSFDAVIKGAVYGREIAAAEAQGRVCDVAFDPALQLIAACDLGMRDAFAVWLLQEHFVGGQVRAIDYREFHNMGLPQVQRELAAFGYNPQRWIFPHDIAVREQGTGRSRIEVAREIGMNPDKSNDMSRADGIEAVRSVIPLMVFDRKRCGVVALDAMRQYRYEHDDFLNISSKEPVHDWTSHCADALRTYATARSGALRTNWRESLRDIELQPRRQSAGARRVGR
jgi:phage terminase large subunit